MVAVALPVRLLAWFLTAVWFASVVRWFYHLVVPDHRRHAPVPFFLSGFCLAAAGAITLGLFLRGPTTYVPFEELGAILVLTMLGFYGLGYAVHKMR